MIRHVTRGLAAIFILSLFSFLPSQGFAQADSLKTRIRQISKAARGDVGVALMLLDNREAIMVNGNKHYPMQSVYKLPLAMAILDMAQREVISLDDEILIEKKDLVKKTWSPIRDKYPEGNVRMKIRDIMSYTVSQSDNIGCDILFRIAGGPQKVQEYIHSIGVSEIAIAATEAQMAANWDVQYTNWTEPAAMLQLLDILYQRKLLSEANSDLLIEMMTETTTGPNRIKGLLPSKTTVAHKTGSSGANAQGLTGATNDVGVITLPNGRQLAIAIFISKSTASEKTQEEVIAKISKAAWDFYVEENTPKPKVVGLPGR